MAEDITEPDSQSNTAHTQIPVCGGRSPPQAAIDPQGGAPSPLAISPLSIHP